MTWPAPFEPHLIIYPPAIPHGCWIAVRLHSSSPRSHSLTCSMNSRKKEPCVLYRPHGEPCCWYSHLWLSCVDLWASLALSALFTTDNVYYIDLLSLQNPSIAKHFCLLPLAVCKVMLADTFLTSIAIWSTLNLVLMVIKMIYYMVETWKLLKHRPTRFML